MSSQITGNKLNIEKPWKTLLNLWVKSDCLPGKAHGLKGFPPRETKGDQGPLTSTLWNQSSFPKEVTFKTALHPPNRKCFPQTKSPKVLRGSQRTWHPNSKPKTEKSKSWRHGGYPRQKTKGNWWYLRPICCPRNVNLRFTKQLRWKEWRTWRHITINRGILNINPRARRWCLIRTGENRRDCLTLRREVFVSKKVARRGHNKGED